MDTLIKGTEKFNEFATIKYVDSATHEGSGRVIYFRTKTDFVFSISYGPTMNCQFMSMGYACGLTAQHSVNGSEKLKQMLQTMTMIGYAKQMVMVDVRENYIAGVKEVFAPFLKNNPYTDKTIQLEAPYVSTNGSHMCIMLFNIDWELINKSLKEVKV